MKLGRLSIRQVAERFGADPRAVRAELKDLHARKGGLLFRYKGGHGRNTKLWVDLGRLKELLPERFGAPTERDLAILHGRVDRVELLAERALQRIGRVEQRNAK